MHRPFPTLAVSDDQKKHRDQRRKHPECAVAERLRPADVSADHFAVRGAFPHQRNDGPGETKIHEDGGGGLEAEREAEFGVGPDAERADKIDADDDANALDGRLAEEKTGQEM